MTTRVARATCPPGATVGGGGTRFAVWAPAVERVVVEIEGKGSHDLAPLDDALAGMWSVTVDGVGHGDRYAYSLDEGPPLADPASALLPDGVHGPSAVVDPARFAWTDETWRGRDLAGSIVYELHVGTFTPGGTLDTAIADLPRLSALGITTIELMPVNAFPGSRNWGYDGVTPWSVHAGYGGPEALARFVDAAHAHGLAVLLDVVFNHIGPEGNHLAEFGPYFTDAYRTPWGPAINVAGPGSDGVRRFLIECTRRWVRDFHVDGFRFDAVHAIVDTTADPLWAQVGRAARDEAGGARRRIALIAESSDNNPRELHPADRDGYGFDGVWSDDVHHTLRVAATGDRRTYYADYDGTPAELADTVEHRWKFRGQYSIARGRSHGRPVDDVAPHRFVVCSQNHDQVGNRPAGDRPDHHMTPAQRRFAAAFVLLAPFTPMLFQGEEYGERRPFPYFVDHTDPDVLRATNDGRRAEFAGADWSVEVPEPGARSTFESAILDPARGDPALLAMYTELIRLRREHPAIWSPAARQRVGRHDHVVTIERTLDGVTTTVWSNPSDVAFDLPAGADVRFVSTSDVPTNAWTVTLTIAPH